MQDGLVKGLNNIAPSQDLAFESLSEVKFHIAHGCEVEFVWKGKYYVITHPEGKITIGEGYYLSEGKAYNVLSHTEYDDKSEISSENIDEVLEYRLGEDRLRDVVTKIKIVDRTT